jgi:hypothetical protein
MADFEVVKSHLSTNKLSYFTFSSKSQKPIKAVIRHLPQNTAAEDISDGLVTLGFDVVSAKLMTTTHGSPSEERITRHLPLFLITLSRTVKSQEIFQLQSLCHIFIRVEAYRAESGLTQCHNLNNLATSGLIVSNLPVACGAGVATCTNSVHKQRTLPPFLLAATVS